MKKHILVLDIGNTTIYIGLYIRERLARTWRIASDRGKTADEYFAIINTLLRAYTDDKDIDIDAIAVSSVSPMIGKSIAMMIEQHFETPFIFVDGNTTLGLKFGKADPNRIGADLIVNAYSAMKKYETNCIVCDFGTATTIQLIGVEGTFYGTAILPGLMTAAQKLFDTAALLKNIYLESPKELLGTNTIDSLQSGIVRGHAYSVDGFITDIKKKYKHIGNIRTIATGGIAKLVATNSKKIDVVDESLTLEGLYLIATTLLL